jgi:monofunctional biosynthetic peptidoglycan transglycosylase
MRLAVPRFLRPALAFVGLWLKRVVLTILGLWAFGLFVYRWVDAPVTPLMVIRLFEGEGLSIHHVRLEEIAPSVPRAVIASEDNRFCVHHGIDLGAVRDAVDDFADNGRLRGASTLTMQLARNLFMWPGGGAVRKAFELPLALAIDALWPKERIIELYLQVAEWGPGVYGIEAAARKHFDKHASQLTRREAALLAAVLPAPRRWDPNPPSAYLSRRAVTIEGRMRQLAPDWYRCLPDES